jgi:hypothetical protein
MESLEDLKQEVERIKERNSKVETDKAWETSVFRKVLIAILTYFTIVLFFYFIRPSSPFLNAVVPAIGFLLSTLSIPLFKSWWVNNKYKK